MITTVLFDLDGTLLPMDQEAFIRAYIGGMTAKLLPHGYDPKRLTRSIWQGIGAMTANDGSRLNEEVFWEAFSGAYSRDLRPDVPLFNDFYHNEFQDVRNACGFATEATQVIRWLKERNMTVALATNPLFPAVATHSRIRWAGLEPGDFTHITTYENSRRCKPNPDYYREVLDALGAVPEECLMVGNDATEDTAAQALGIRVFLLTPCLINKENRDLSPWPQGGFPELMDYLRRMCI